MSLFTDLKEVLTPYANRIKWVGNQISEVNEYVANKVGVIRSIKDFYIDLTNEDPVSLTPHASTTGLAYSVVDCVEGDRFVINAVGAASARAWGFLDSSNHVLSIADANATVTDLELTAPTNAVKLVINNKGGGTSYKVGNNLAGRVSALEKGGSGLSDEAKEALLTCFKHAVWTDDSAYEYKNNLRKALYGWDTDTMYKLMNTPVSLDGSTTINTDFIIWKTDYSFTLFADYIDNTNHSVDTENKMFFRQYRVKPWGAFYMQTYNGGISGSNYKVTTVIDLASGSGDSIRRVWRHLESRSVNPRTPRRVVITYNSESHSVTLDFSVNGQIITPDSTTGDLSNFGFYEMNISPMLIGSLEENSRFFNGIINDFRIIKKAATSEEIEAYLTGGNNA